MAFQLSEEEVASLPDLLRREEGNMAAVARKLGVERSAIHKRVHNSEELTKIVQEVRESFIDEVERNMRKFARSETKAGLTAGIFVLKTLGKSRGYVERVEQETVSFDEIERAIEAMNPDQKAESRKRIKAGESAIAVCREIAGRNG